MILEFFQKGRNIVLTWAVFLSFGIFLFQFSLFPELKVLSENADLPEERFGFSSDYIYGFLDKIGEPGRSLYFSFQLLDYVNALLLGLAVFGTLYYFLGRITKKRLARVILTFPVLAAVFDLFENSLICYLLSFFPDRSDSTAEFISLFTKLKLTAGGFSGLLIIVCGVSLLLKFIWGKVKH